MTVTYLFDLILCRFPHSLHCLPPCKTLDRHRRRPAVRGGYVGPWHFNCPCPPPPLRLMVLARWIGRVQFVSAMAPKRAREASQGVGRAKSSRGASKAAGSVEDIEDIKFTLAEVEQASPPHRAAAPAYRRRRHRVRRLPPSPPVSAPLTVYAPAASPADPQQPAGLVRRKPPGAAVAPQPALQAERRGGGGSGGGRPGGRPAGPATQR